MDRVNWMQANALLVGAFLVAVGLFFCSVAPQGEVDRLAVATVIVGGVMFSAGALSWWARGWIREIQTKREVRASQRGT